MEDILASIRRILSEDETQHAAGASDDAGSGHAAPPSSLAPPAGHAPDVLVLDPGMMVPDPPGPPATPVPPPETPMPPLPNPEPLSLEPLPPPEPPESPVPTPAAPPPEPAASARLEAAAQAAPGSAPELTLDQGPLVDVQTRLAAASSVGNLVRTLSAGRAAAVYRGGPTLEDMVRDLLRPLLKEWLDSHLPPLVERLVATEIERVVRSSGI